MKLISKGGPGSGRRPGSGTTVPPGGIRLSKPRVPRSGIRPSELFPHGRNPDGSPKPAPSSNDPKPAGKPKR